MCFSSVFGLRWSRSAIPVFDAPSAMSRSTSRSRSLRASSGETSRGRSSSWATTCGSMAEPPTATCRTELRKEALSVMRSFRR